MSYETLPGGGKSPNTASSLNASGETDDALVDIFEWTQVHDSLMYLSSPMTPRKRGKMQKGIKTPLLRPEPGQGVGDSTFTQATFNAINLLLGVGILSLPFAVKTSGWLIAPPLLLFLSVVTNYTGKLLGRCLEYKPGMKDYPDIGYEAFGTRGRYFISFLFFIELFTACCMYIILMGDNLNKLFPHMTAQQLMGIAFAIVLPTTWLTDLSILSNLSIVGILSSLFLMGVLLFLGLTQPRGEFGGSILEPEPTLMLAEMDRIPLALGLVMVGFAGHAVFPSIYMSMKRRDQYPEVLNITYMVTCTVYMLMAVCGYLAYGPLTQQEITLNLLQSNPGKLAQATTWLIVVNPFTKFALTAYPLNKSLEDMVLPKGKSEWCTVMLSRVLRTVVAAAIAAASISIPFFARVVSFTGAFCSFTVSAIFPCACFLRMYGEKLGWLEKAWCYFVIVVCIVFAIFGTMAVFLSPIN